MGMSKLKGTERASLIPKTAGISLKQEHFKEIAETQPDVGFLELRIDNCHGNGLELYFLEQVKEYYNFSFNNLGALLGSSQRLSKGYLEKIKALTDKFNPLYISDYVSCSLLKGAHISGLLPLPYNEKTLNVLCDNISRIQDYLSRQILIENPLSHLAFKGTMDEPEFLMRVVERTGCNMLLNVSNIFVNSVNHNFNPKNYIDLISANIVKQIHLSGFTETEINGNKWIVSTCDNSICEEVWGLYSYTISEKGYVPTLIEWDCNLPNLKNLIVEAGKCNKIIKFYSFKNAA